MSLLRRRDKTPRSKDHTSLAEVLRGAKLPTFPRVATAALQQLGDPDVDLRSVGDLLLSDPGLSARLLRMVNSASVGTRREVESVHQAVSLLGVSQLESILISSGVREVMPAVPVAGHDPQQFWHAAARRAAIASSLARRVVPSMTSETFTAALLQDMAIPLLAGARPDYGTVVEDWRSGKSDLRTLEHDSFGSDHAVVAGQLCDEWDFPASLRAAIESHHEHPGGEQGIPFVQLVAVLRDTDEDDDRDHLLDLATESLNLEREETIALVDAGEAEAATLTALLS